MADCDESFEYTPPAFRNYHEVVKLYRKFLKGEVEYCPTHGGPLEKESAPLVPALLSLNSGQVVTIDSQPGIISEDYQQRAYVEFFIKEPVWLQIEQDLITSDLIRFSERVSKLPHDMPLIAFPLCPLSIFKSDDGKWIAETYLLPVRSTMEIDFITANCEESSAKRIRKQLIWGIIADPVWGRNTLLDRLVAMLK